MDIAIEEIIEWIEEAISYVGDPAWSPSLEIEGRKLLAKLQAPDACVSEQPPKGRELAKELCNILRDATTSDRSSIDPETLRLAELAVEAKDQREHEGVDIEKWARDLVTSCPPRSDRPSHVEPRKYEILAGMHTWPDDLHDDTIRLVMAFAAAMANKLAVAQRKYGYSNGWAEKDWMDECRAKLVEHIAKGDPRDVANYCAFLWFHNEPTAADHSSQYCGNCGHPVMPNKPLEKE